MIDTITAPISIGKQNIPTIAITTVFKVRATTSILVPLFLDPSFKGASVFFIKSDLSLLPTLTLSCGCISLFFSGLISPGSGAFSLFSFVSVVVLLFSVEAYDIFCVKYVKKVTIIIHIINNLYIIFFISSNNNLLHQYLHIYIFLYILYLKSNFSILLLSHFLFQLLYLCWYQQTQIPFVLVQSKE